MANPTSYTIIRDDGQHDAIAGRRFASFDAAYTVLERYYADSCCSDESATYRIVEEGGGRGSASATQTAADQPQPAPQ